MRLMKIFIIFQMFFNLSCKTTDDKLGCLADKNQEWQQLEVYKDVQIQLANTLQVWVESNIKAVQHYKKNIWKIDETVFFNTSQNAAVLMVLEQDTAKDAKMDDVQLIYAKKTGDKWNFFYRGMNTLSAERYYRDKKDPTKPYTFEELSNIAKKKIIEGGYFKNGTCEINDRYINDWYNENLEKKHQKFLNDK